MDIVCSDRLKPIGQLAGGTAGCRLQRKARDRQRTNDATIANHFRSVALPCIVGKVQSGRVFMVASPRPMLKNMRTSKRRNIFAG